MNYAVNGGGIETGLLAASKQPYRTYGVAGTMLLDEVIPNQYETAKRQNPNIKTIVMTGGGNDLLLTGMTAGGCGEGCMTTIDKVTDRLKKMWDEMAADGVQDVIYIEYSRGGTNEPGVSYANKVIPPVCAAAPVRCHFIDSDLIINKQLIDGVHPTADGCQKLGKAAFDLMVEKGMRR
jgi:lysophospholipase L1-like esterase